MRITLKKIILVGAMLLSAVFFLLAVATPITVKAAGLFGGEVKASLLGCASGKPLNDVFAVSYTGSSIDGYKAWVDGCNGTLAVFGVISLILIIFDFLAIVGGFFLPTPAAARKLIIPFMAISIVLLPIGMIVFAVLTNVTYSANGYSMTLSQSNPGIMFIMYVLGIVFFIGALIASGVVSEKVFVGKK